MLRENSPEWWEREGEKKALVTFHQAAQRVPAYKDFLKKHNVNPEKVVTIEDFKQFVPVMTKNEQKNY
jgi:phenylacetate-CoA ligase